MDRQIVYPGQVLPETTLLQMTKDAMIGLAKLSAAMLGTSTIANGFAVTPTTPASLQVLAAPGEIYSLQNIDSTAFSSLAADTTHQIVKQGISLDSVTLNCPAPGTSGQSINYLVEVSYQDADANPVLLPYYNSANPSAPYSGLGNNGLTQNTARKGAVIVQVKAGVSAATGSQTTPAPDSGFVGLYVVTVAYGQTTITAGNISQYSAAPLLPSGLLPAHQSGALSYASDTGAANVYAAAYTPAITSLVDGMVLRFKAANANTGASTFNPNGLGAKPIVGGAHAALQGGEIVVNSDVWLQYNSSIGSGSWVMVDSTGGAMQTAPATQSQHAMQLGQAIGRLIGVKVFTASGTYTRSPGVNSALIKLVGGGGAGGGSPATTSAQVSVGAGGCSGSYAEAWITSVPASASVTIGTAGTGVSGGVGGSGGTTSFGSLVSATGGNGGNPAGPSAPPINIGNNNTGATVIGANVFGAVSQMPPISFVSSLNLGYSATSAGGLMGSGGATLNATGNGSNAGGYGGGGSGALSLASSAAQIGGQGSPGICIVYEYA